MDPSARQCAEVNGRARVRVRTAPVAQQEDRATVPVPRPGPPCRVHSCEGTCTAACGAVVAVLYFLTQKRREMRAIT